MGTRSDPPSWLNIVGRRPAVDSLYNSRLRAEMRQANPQMDIVLRTVHK